MTNIEGTLGAEKKDLIYGCQETGLRGEVLFPFLWLWVHKTDR